MRFNMIEGRVHPMVGTLQLDGLTPSQRRAAILQDNKIAQQKAKAEGEMINRQVGVTLQRVEAKTEAALQRLVGGEGRNFEDITYLCDLFQGAGEEPDEHASSLFLYRLNQEYTMMKRVEQVKLDKAHRAKIAHLESEFVRYISMKDKRDTKQLVASFQGTPFEKIVNQVDAKVIKRVAKPSPKAE
jgi:hypothetical protein